jgi:hypothetical protein
MLIFYVSCAGADRNYCGRPATWGIAVSKTEGSQVYNPYQSLVGGRGI